MGEVVCGGMLPGIDEKAVRAAEDGEENRSGKKDEAERGIAGDGGDEDGRGEEDSDGDLFWQAMGL